MLGHHRVGVCFHYGTNELTLYIVCQEDTIALSQFNVRIS